jgi:carboxyl-terminal processing protease
MNDLRKTAAISAVTVLSCACLLAGVARRNQVDVGKSQVVLSSDQSLEGLLAFKGKGGTDISEEHYFEQLTALLKENYVDELPSPEKMALGAIRGMVTSLGDPQSLFLESDQFKAYRNALKGDFEGIGAELILDVEKAPNGKVKIAGSGGEDEDGIDTAAGTVPVIKVVSVVPGGPAEKAGVKPGDWVEAVNGHWVLNPKMIAELREIRAHQDAGDLPQEEISKRMNSLADRAKNSILPLKAMAKLITGTSGSVDISWSRAGKSLQTKIAKASSHMPAIRYSGDIVKLHLQEGAAQELKKVVADKSSVTIDLRQNAVGSFSEVMKVLAVLAPSGTYGQITDKKGSKPQPLKVTDGNTKPLSLTLIVDRTTAGPAEILATALSSKGKAKIQGGPMAGSHEIVKAFELPTGAGYTLVTGIYSAGGAK